MAIITVRNIPDDLYERLKRAARAHRRSLDSELISCLEAVLGREVVSVEERLARIRSMRAKIPPNAVSMKEIRQAIGKGRS